MSYFSQSQTPDESATLPRPEHVIKDVGFFEAAGAAAGNSYGVFEEQETINERMTGAIGFVMENATDDERYEINNQPLGYDEEALLIDFVGRIKARGIEVPEEYDFAEFEQMAESAFDAEAVRYQERQDVLERATTRGKVGSFFGAVAGGVDDIENIVTIPFGIPARAGIAMRILGEAALNGGIEGVAFAPRQEFLAKLGVESDETLMQAMGMGALFGAAIPATVAGVTSRPVRNAASSILDAPYTLGRRVLGNRTPVQVADALIDSGHPRVAAQGHAIRADIAMTDMARAAQSRSEASVALDADFLNGVIAGRNTPDAGPNAAPLLLENGMIEVPVRTSDGAVQVSRVPAETATSANLQARYDDGEAIPIKELDQLGIEVGDANMIRPMLQYFDDMDSRFKGKEVPDQFDPVDEADFVTSSRFAEPTTDAAKETPLAQATPDMQRSVPSAEINLSADFNNNLSRMARYLGAIERKNTPAPDGPVDGATARPDAEPTAAEVEEFGGALAQVDKISIGERNGAAEYTTPLDVVKDIQEDVAMAQAAKECMI